MVGGGNSKRKSLGTKSKDLFAPAARSSSQNRENLGNPIGRGGTGKATPSSGARKTIHGSSLRAPLSNVPSTGSDLGGNKGTKLPRLSTVQSQPTSGTRRPRSVSHHGGPSSRATMGAPGLHGGAPGSHMKTPRSVSSGRSRTPVSAGRSGGGAGAGPLGHRQNPSRLSMAAVGTSGSNGRMNEVGRQSAIGMKNRVMQDKAYQKEVERELVEFCLAQGYPNIHLSSSSFPLSSTEFKQMFAFLVRFLIPDFNDLVTGFETTVPVTLKDTLGYPTHVSKQTFQTLGTIHSWPAVLACLLYVYNMAKVTVELADLPPEKLDFNTKDADGFQIDEPGSDQLKYDAYVKMYAEYIAGSEEYADQLEDLETEMMQAAGIDRAEMEKKISEQKKHIEDIQSLSEATQSADELTRSLENRFSELQSDIKSMIKYNQTQKANIINRTNEIKALQEQKAAHNEKISSLEVVIAELREVCIKEKHIDPDKDDRVNYVIKELEDQIQDLRQRVFDSDESKWQAEMGRGKAVAQLEKIFLAFNRALVEVGHEDTRLESATHTPQYVRQFLHKITSDLKAEERSLSSQAAGLKRELQLDTKEIQSLMVDREKVKEGLEVKTRELRELREDSEESHHRLSEELEELKATLLALQDEGSRDIEKLDQELEGVKRELGERQKQFENLKRTLKEIAEKTYEGLLLKRQKQLRAVDEASNEYKRLAEEKIAAINHETKQIKGIANILPKPK